MQSFATSVVENTRKRAQFRAVWITAVSSLRLSLPSIKQNDWKIGSPCMCAWTCLHFLWERSGEMYILKQTLALTTADIAIAILTASNAIGDIATSSIVTLGNVLSTLKFY
uniref:Uncharacterized protein n=1 Tax=Glossina austeni TaxID=7395 RepID=A0A1A9V5D3_GLOAU